MVNKLQTQKNKLESVNRQIKLLEKDLIKTVSIIGLEKVDLNNYVIALDTLKTKKQTILYRIALLDKE